MEIVRRTMESFRVSTSFLLTGAWQCRRWKDIRWIVQFRRHARANAPHGVVSLVVVTLSTELELNIPLNSKKNTHLRKEELPTPRR